MPTLRRYVARQFGTNMGLMLLAFVSLLQLLDLLANADDIVKLHGTGLSAFLRHAMLNTPEIATVVTPICALLASLLTLARLALGNDDCSSGNHWTSRRLIFCLFGPRPMSSRNALLTSASVME